MPRIILLIVLSFSFVAAKPAIAVFQDYDSIVLANSRRKNSYQTAVYFAAILSVFDVVLGAIWASHNEILPVVYDDPARKPRATTIYAVSAASPCVAGLAVLASGSLAIRAMNEVSLLNMHHDGCRGWVGFREFFTPFVLLAQAGLQTWAGIELSKLVPFPDFSARMFWVTNGFMIGAFVAGVFVPITGGILVRHRPFK